MVETLLELKEGRAGHGCGSYSQDGKKVFQTFLIFLYFDNCGFKVVSGNGGFSQ